MSSQIITLKKRIVLVILFCLAFTSFILLFSYQATLFFFPLTTAQENTLHFLQGKEQLQIEYTEQEMSHLQDVAMMMKILDYILYITFVVSIVILIYSRKEIRQLLFYGGMTILTVVFLIVISILTNFATLFTLFHQLFFPQGNWQFPVGSALLQVFPLSFFVTFSRFMFLPAIVIALLCFIVSFFLKKKVLSS